MASVPAQLAALLSSVRRPGDFCASGAVDFLAPSLEVEGVGPVAFPLLPVQAAQLIAAADPAPFGRGADTVYDPAVRNCGQIGPERVRLAGRHWAGTLEGIVRRAAEGLGVEEPVEAEFYKLLVYDKGSFFLSHRDTEKAPGMFATLVVVLPSRYAGGELAVRHKGREARLDLRRDDPAEAAFAAFYADCVHEILPITEGCRLALVYNLMRREPGKRGRAPEPPEYGREQARIAALLEQWRAEENEEDGAAEEADGEEDEYGDGDKNEEGGDQDGDDADQDEDGGDYDYDYDYEYHEQGAPAPEKLVYPLEHAYTPAELGFAALKGADAAAAGVLEAAAREAGYDLFLAQLSIEESGQAEYADHGWSRRGRRIEEEFEAGEVDDRSMTLSLWQRPDGQPCALGDVPVGRKELSPPDACDGLKPDEEQFLEATGNAGATFERTYRRAALVLWPSERYFAVVCQAGLDATVPMLADLAHRWAASGEGAGSALWREAHELAGHMLGHWRARTAYSRDDAPGHAGQALAALAQLGDADMIGRYVTEAVAAGSYRIGDNPAVLAALERLPPPRRADLVERILAGTAATHLAACADLLARAAAAWPQAGGRGHLVGAAKRLLDALPGDPAREASRPHWQARSAPGVGAVVNLVAALCAVDAELAVRAADCMLAWSGTYGLDEVLLPAVRQLTAMDAVRGTAAVARLREACLAHLRARIAEPLAPPTDWRRASKLPCRCPRCTELAAFLDDPHRQTWVLKAVEAERGHVEDTIRRAGSDVDCTTDRRGRPYTLVCTKNQASYERRAKQRKQDLEDVARLGG